MLWYCSLLFILNQPGQLWIKQKNNNTFNCFKCILQSFKLSLLTDLSELWLSYNNESNRLQQTDRPTKWFRLRLWPTSHQLSSFNGEGRPQVLLSRALFQVRAGTWVEPPTLDSFHTRKNPKSLARFEPTCDSNSMTNYSATDTPKWLLY